MEPSSRTPEGEPNRCPICGNRVVLEPSDGTRDAPCPNCGCLLWFDGAGATLDKDQLEHTKRTIRQLVSEIEQLSKQSLSQGEFCGEFLSRLVSALAAVGGAVWIVGNDGRSALQCQINLRATKLRDNEAAQRQHSRLLAKALANGQGTLVQPHAEFGEEAETANPTDFLLVLGPLRHASGVFGVVEIFQRSETNPAAQKGYLRFLRQMCELASESPALRNRNYAL
jgi:hypothetical protein